MEDKIIEQPAYLAPEVEMKNSVPAEDNAEEGLGKFKDAEQLLKAYQNLEKEFTKKSQRLKELEKSDLTTANPQNWRERVDGFVNKYPIATKYLTDVEAELKTDENLLKKENCLETALLRVLAKKHKTAGEYATDKDFLVEATRQNAEVRDSIISEYISAINKEMPRTLPNGGAVPATPPKKPLTLADAGEMALKILKK